MVSIPFLSRSSPHGTLADPPSALLDQYEEHWRRVRNLTSETIRLQRVYLDRFVAQIGFDSSGQLLKWLSGPRLRHFAIEYAQTHGRGSQKHMLYSLRSFLWFCHNQGFVTADLRAAVPVPRRWRLARVPRAIDDVIIDRLLASIDRSCPLGRRDAAIIILASTYGVRSIQLRRLRLADIDWDAEWIHFRPAKGGKALRLPLTAQAGNAVLDYLKRGRANQAPYHELFLRSRPPFRPMCSSGSLSSMVSRRLRQAGIDLPEGVSRGLHSFRHAFAARLAGRVPFKHIADLMGHRNLSSTFTYTKIDFARLSEAALPWPEEVHP